MRPREQTDLFKLDVNSKKYIPYIYIVYGLLNKKKQGKSSMR